MRVQSLTRELVKVNKNPVYCSCSGLLFVSIFKVLRTINLIKIPLKKQRFIEKWLYLTKMKPAACQRATFVKNIYICRSYCGFNEQCRYTGYRNWVQSSQVNRKVRHTKSWKSAFNWRGECVEKQNWNTGGKFKWTTGKTYCFKTGEITEQGREPDKCQT